MRLFEEALRQTRASVPPEMEEEYRRLLEALKRENPRGKRIGFGEGPPTEVGPPVATIAPVPAGAPALRGPTAARRGGGSGEPA